MLVELLFQHVHLSIVGYIIYVGGIVISTCSFVNMTQSDT